VNNAAILEPEESRTLDMEKKKIHRVLDPRDLISLALETALAVNLTARKVGRETPRLHATDQFFSVTLLQLDEVVGSPVNREAIDRRLCEAGLEERLVVSGEEDLSGGIVAVRIDLKPQTDFSRQNLRPIPEVEEIHESNEGIPHFAGRQSPRLLPHGTVRRDLREKLQASVNGAMKRIAVQIILEEW